MARSRSHLGHWIIRRKASEQYFDYWYCSKFVTFSSSLWCSSMDVVWSFTAQIVSNIFSRGWIPLSNRLYKFRQNLQRQSPDHHSTITSTLTTKHSYPIVEQLIVVILHFLWLGFMSVCILNNSYTILKCFDFRTRWKKSVFSRLLDILWVGVGYEDWHGDFVYFLLEERIEEIIGVFRHVAPQWIRSLP